MLQKEPLRNKEQEGLIDTTQLVVTDSEFPSPPQKIKLIIFDKYN